MATSPDSFTDTQVLVSRASCPACDSRQLDLRLSCEKGGRCTYKALCQDCGMAFAVHDGPKPDGIDELLPNLACPSCGNLGAEFAMICELPTRTCETMVTCASCHHPFRKTA